MHKQSGVLASKDGIHPGRCESAHGERGGRKGGRAEDAGGVVCFEGGWAEDGFSGVAVCLGYVSVCYLVLICRMVHGLFFSSAMRSDYPLSPWGGMGSTLLLFDLIPLPSIPSLSLSPFSLFLVDSYFFLAPLTPETQG